MKFETFEKLISAAINHVSVERERACVIESAFGRDSVIEFDDSIVGDIVDAIADDMETDEFMYDVLWEFVYNDSDSIYFDGSSYAPTMENLYRACKGELC